MAVFVTSTSAATLHGVYAIERVPPATIQATGTGTAAIVAEFPWGPDGEVYTIADMKDFGDKFAPAGMSRTGSGYLSVAGKSWPVLKVVRVLGTSAAKATAAINKTGPTLMLTLTLKYKGTAGNSVTATIAAASDGDANHFNLTVTASNAYGTTVDKLENLNYSGVGTDSAPDLSNCLLLGSITKASSGTPIVGTTTFSGGADGTINSAAYLGTPGSADTGCALLEADNAVDVVFTADPGNSLRAAVNAGLVAHADLKTDRIAVINGNSGITAAAAVTDVANYRSKRAAYIDVWPYIKDDTDATERLVPPAPFAASVLVSLAPSTSMAWKSSTVRRLTNQITKLETARGNQAYTNTLAGICTLMREPTGGFTFESAVNTNAPVSPSTKSLTRTRMAHYIARSVVDSLREYVDSPNVAQNQQDEVAAVQAFLEQLKTNATTDPNNLPHIVDFTIRPLADFNTTVTLAAGDFTIAADVQTSSAQERIFLSLNVGESVTVTAAV